LRSPRPHLPLLATFDWTGHGSNWPPQGTGGRNEGTAYGEVVGCSPSPTVWAEIPPTMETRGPRCCSLPAVPRWLAPPDHRGPHDRQPRRDVGFPQRQLDGRPDPVHGPIENSSEIAGGAGGARTHDRRIMRSMASCIARASRTNTTEPCRRSPCAHWLHRWLGPRTGPRLTPVVSRLRLHNVTVGPEAA
jgi:hypothetical protein